MSADADIRYLESELEAAMVWIGINRPYYQAVLWGLRRIWTDHVPTFAVDDKMRLYMNPRFCQEVLEEEQGISKLIGVLVHECNHVIRLHSDRCGTRERRLWNYAGDFEINQDLVSDGMLLPGLSLLPGVEIAGVGKTYQMPPGLTAEQYYDLLFQNAESLMAQNGHDSGDEHGEGVACGSCGSGADGSENDDALDKAAAEAGVEGASEVDIEVTRAKVASAVRDALKDKDARGTVPAGLGRWAEDFGRPQVDWRQRFRQEAVRCGRICQGSGHYTYQRRSRRHSQKVGDPVFPRRVARRPEVAIVVDTSGSMTDGMLGSALSEIQGILRATRSRSVTVWACDAETSAPQIVQNASDVSLIGGGGTDMRVGIEAAMSKPCDMVVVLTDGWTPWPDSPLDVPLLACIINGHKEGVPNWARVVPIDETA